MVDRTLPEWRDYLLPRLEARRPIHARLRDYYSGRHVLPTAPDRASNLYLRLAELGVTNMCGLVVDTVNERLRPKGVRLSADPAADVDVWRRVWQANNLDADWPTAQEEALKVGRGFVLVWPSDDGQGDVVTVEDPDEVIVWYKPGSRRERVAALKAYCDDDTEYVQVWTDGRTQSWERPYRRQAQARMSTDGAILHLPPSVSIGTASRVWTDDAENTGVNPYGRVPVIELRSKPSVKGDPQPELSTAVLRLQDRINKTMFDAVTASESGAFPQRYGIGIEVRVGTDGLPVNPMTVGPNRTWILKPSTEGGTATIGQLDAFPLDGLLALCDASIKHLASISQTPVYYLLSGLTNVGADSIRAAETGHVAKIMRHQTTFGDAAEEVFRLVLGGDAPDDIEIDWAPPETRSPAELADAAIKLQQAGFPFPALARYLGMTQSELNRVLKEKEAETAAAPTPVPPTAAPAPVTAGTPGFPG